MSFAKIRPIERATTMIDIAFRKGATRVSNAKAPSRDYTKKMRELERIRMAAMCNDLKTRFDAILNDFPSIDNLTPFYRELVICTMEYDIVKKSLGGMKWARDKIDYFQREYNFKVTRCEDVEKMREYRQQLYGRVASIVKQVDKNLKVLEEARKIITEFPVVKNMGTVAIAGFPNVGKTTLLSKLTGSTPEIAHYAFTTKTLNMGYIEFGRKKVQVIDTPGTLNRFNKMNNIEKQAYLAIKHTAHLIIYIFDPSEEYPMQDQIALYEMIKKFDKPILVYVSKTDIVENEAVEGLISKFNATSDVSLLKKLINQKFSDPKVL